MRCNRDMANTSGKALRRLGLAAAVACVGMMGGCAKSFLDQSELVRNEGNRLLVPILDSIDPIDDPSAEFRGAEEVKPEDLKAYAVDYVIGRNDLITVSVYDLVAGGVETVRTARVSETGMLSLPQLSDPIKAAGFTEQQLQRAIANAYKTAGILQEAKVSVTVVEARQRTFSILGAVARPGQYAILDADFRILNALVQAGDVTANVENLYIVRKLKSEQPAAATTEPSTTTPNTDHGPADVTPKAPVDLAPPGTNDKETGPKTEATMHGGPVLAMMQDSGKAGPAPAGNPDQKFIIIDGKTVPLNPSTRPANAAAPTTRPAMEHMEHAADHGEGMAAEAGANAQPGYQFGTLKADEDQRIIRVPLEQLRKGDLRYNIVVRPSDTIIIPVPNVGFYYMYGHFAGVGAYNLTGQKINLKQATASARGLDPFAVPSKTDIIRRVGNNELFVRVNLEKIFEGKEPDFYLKPNDIVQVGTDWYPPFLVALRGAFRMTYGFGFLYDRNYAPQQKIQQ